MIIGYMLYLVYNFIAVNSLRYIIKSLFLEKGNNSKLDIFIALTWFVTSSILHIYLSIPLINFIVMIIGCISLGYIYSKDLKSSILVCTLTLVIFTMIETTVGLLVYVLNNSNDIEIDGFKSMNVSYILISISILIASRLFVRFKGIKKVEYIKPQDLILIYSVPLLTIVVLFVMTYNSKNPFTFSVVMLVLLIINLVIFYLIESVSKYIMDSNEKETLERQNIMYVKQNELFNEYNNENMSLIHDNIKHLSMIKEYVNQKDNVKIENYINKLLNSYETKKLYSKCGIIEVDAIINSNLNNVRNDLCNIKCINELSTETNVANIDLTVLLGNMLENAVKEINKLKECNLDIFIKKEKNMLVINVVNDYDGNILFKNDLPINKNRKSYGIKNINKVVNKYNGHLIIKTDNNIFSITSIIII